jgi:hypothetical protein
VSPLAGATPVQAAAPPFTLATKTVVRSVPTSTVVRVRVGRHARYDRLVIDLRGKAPGYRIGYVHFLVPPSGKKIDLRGAANLSVALTPAKAHRASGKSTLRPQRRVLHLPQLREYRLIEDFEGVVVLGVGVHARKAFRVLTLAHPTRIVVDVHH